MVLMAAALARFGRLLLVALVLGMLVNSISGVSVKPSKSAGKTARYYSESKEDAVDDIMTFRKVLDDADHGVSASELLEPDTKPYIIPLRRESVPVRRQGKIVSYKTSYSGFINVGFPDPQAFRVVFDTGSGHIILPSSACKSDSCLVHANYNMSKSTTATPINVDGSTVHPGELCDQVTIGYGTGSVTGEFVRDQVCLGSGEGGSRGPCIEAGMVSAIEMSTQPFKNFGFDGILGLGLGSLALAPEFSFFNLFAKSDHVTSPTFGVYLTEGDDGDDAEIAFGGHNRNRIMGEIGWSPVVMSDMGYWQVEIVAFRVDGVTMDFCKDGSCRGVVDTGTSHLGIPGPYDAQVAAQLTQSAGNLDDCRYVEGPSIEIELKGFNITLNPENYMRRLPLAEGVNVSSSGVSMLNVGLNLSKRTSSYSSTSSDLVQADQKQEMDVPHWCRPRFMPVKMEAPLGPHLFILGEPVLHRYYSMYNWKDESVGFALAKNRWNMNRKGKKEDVPEGADVFLMQMKVRISAEPSMLMGRGMHEAGGVEVVGAVSEIFAQITVAWAAGQPRAAASGTLLA
eukprot:gnl/TRDRNA2_/TRDRNA2_171068_c0_seq1.p1 gnl/TRDRNA2_/TRDRNA2_171068_c0~~gnl/TRDRNA2_/TRDRNA2_171068_c0_seq1.p1  ORF type:complete len:567 (-),score=113.03 gnl/TRDRNA2_/TRDRNA2_171068_c0_seq1:81-1781(-)